ncbi:MAG: class I SAM-dependent methyltransferase, partial [Blastocatellia bacterium]
MLKVNDKTMIDLIEHRIALSTPERLTPHTYWQEHIPFAMYLISALRPGVLVELGTHWGDSYSAFCQAVKALGLKTLCYAVDNWQGDIHTGEYGEEVLADLRAHHDARYGSFSLLLRSDFAAACPQFRDGSIDLLHIDGTHTHEAVKRDFEMWLPKMSPRGVVLLHDTNVVRENFGVKQFFEEIKVGYPHFEFLHCYGLGVLGAGSECPDEVLALFSLNEKDIEAVRD